MNNIYYRIIWFAATIWDDSRLFKTKEQAEEIAKLLKDYHRADSYAVEEITLKDVVENYDSFKSELIKFLNNNKKGNILCKNQNSQLLNQ